MTTYGAYDAGLPCKNTSCRSHGRPHPNCRCYGEMSGGGEVQQFCAQSRAHHADCEYFADGGEVAPEGYELVDDAPAAEDGPEGYELLDEPSQESPEGYEVVEEAAAPAESSYSMPSTASEALSRLGGSGLLQGENRTQPAEGEKISDEQMRLLGQQNEDAARIGGILTGGGAAGLATRASEALAGGKVLQQVIQGGLLQTTDEVSKWLMGEENPEGAAGSLMAIGASSLFSGFLGAASEGVTKGASLGLKKIAEEKFGKKAMSFLSGLGYGASRNAPGSRSAITSMADREAGLDIASFQKGMKYFDKLAAPAGGALIGATSGWHEDGVWGALTGMVKGALYGQAGKYAVKASSKVLAPALLKVLSSGNVKGAAQALDHAAQVAHGSQVIDRTLGSMFSKTPALVNQSVNAYGGDKLKKDLDTFLGKGGMEQSLQEEIYEMYGAEADQQFAEGGDVQKRPKGRPQKGNRPPVLREDDGVSIHYPAQNMLLSTARGRVSNYLKELRPQPNAPRLPFDDEPDNKQQKKKYDRALTVAVSPLSVMHEIQKGTVEPEHIKHLSSMYPELTGLLQKKVTEQIVKAQVSGKKPPYRVRQGLSMLMGAALSAEMTPTSIQAAQSVFQKGGAQPPSSQPAPKKAGDTAKLSKSDQAYLTGSQARQKRAQRPS